MANWAISVGTGGSEAGEPSLLPRGSFFGHDPALKGLVPPGGGLPTHLLLTLDNTDERVAALGIDVGPSIRLVHPYHHSEGDLFGYHHRGGDAIDWGGPIGDGDPSWPRPDLPATFPTRRVVFAEAGPKPERPFGECALIHLGTAVPTVQVYRTPDGKEEGKHHDGTEGAECSAVIPRPFASVPSRPLPDLDLWGGNDFVFALFWYCPSCKAITTHNECD